MGPRILIERVSHQRVVSIPGREDHLPNLPNDLVRLDVTERAIVDEASPQGVVRIGWVLSVAGDMPQQKETV